MKTFNLLLGLLLGLIIGLLSTFGAIGWGLLYFMTGSKKDAKPSGVDRTRSYKSTTKGDSFDHKYDTRAEAEDMIDALKNIIEAEGKVSVADLNIEAGYPPSFADSRRGWKDLSQAHITRDLYDSKYRIVFPAPEYF